MTLKSGKRDIVDMLSFIKYPDKRNPGYCLELDF